MAKMKIDDDLRRKNVTFSAAPVTIPLLRGLAEFYSSLEPDERWSDGRALDRAIELQFFDTITGELRRRYSRLGYSASEPIGWQLGKRGVHLERIRPLDILFTFVDPPGRDLSISLTPKVANIVERLVDFFANGLANVTINYPSYENPFDAQAVVFAYFDWSTGKSWILNSIAAPNEEPPPIGARVVIHNEAGIFHGIVDAAEVLDMTDGGPGRRSLYIVVSGGERPMTSRTRP